MTIILAIGLLFCLIYLEIKCEFRPVAKVLSPWIHLSISSLLTLGILVSFIFCFQSVEDDNIIWNLTHSIPFFITLPLTLFYRNFIKQQISKRIPAKANFLFISSTYITFLLFLTAFYLLGGTFGKYKDYYGIKDLNYYLFTYCSWVLLAIFIIFRVLVKKNKIKYIS